MSEPTDTTAELAEEMRRIGLLGHWPTYAFERSLFWVADRLESLEGRRLNCHKLMLDCWNQFAQLPDGYSTMDLSTLEDLEQALYSLDLIDEDGTPRWDDLNDALDGRTSNDP